MILAIRKADEKEITDITRYDKHISQERLRGCILNGMVYAIEADNAIIGVMRYSLFWQSIPFLDLISIDPRHHGKGIGKQAMAYWESQMRSLGYAYTLTSTQEDETAQFFYEKIGYSRTGEFLPPEQAVKELIYQKHL